MKKWNDIFFIKKKTNKVKLRKLFKLFNIKTNFKIIQIVGTNGKGSVAHHLSEGLVKNNYNVGLFTSPHLLSPTERIQVNGINISEQFFFKIERMTPTLHFFEKMLLIALIYFTLKKVDIVILEAGIGGKHDSTSILKGDIGLVTSIALDHKKILGNSLIKIAKNKAGIINKDMNFFLPSTLDKKIRRVFLNKTKKSVVVPIKSSDYQKENKELASYILNKEFNLNISNFKKLLGRTTIISKNGDNFIFDVAHNNEGIQASLRYLEFKKIKFSNIIFSIKINKNINNLKHILPPNKHIFYYQKNHNFHEFKEFQKIANIEFLPGGVLFIGSFSFIGEVYEKFCK